MKYQKRLLTQAEIEQEVHALAHRRRTNAGKVEREVYEAFSVGKQSWGCSCGKKYLACEEIDCETQGCPVRASLDRLFRKSDYRA